MSAGRQGANQRSVDNRVPVDNSGETAGQDAFVVADDPEEPEDAEPEPDELDVLDVLGEEPESEEPDVDVDEPDASPLAADLPPDRESVR